MRHHVLGILPGVDHAVAGAVLTVWNTENYTMYDYRAVEALDELRRRGELDLDESPGRYWARLTPRTIQSGAVSKPGRAGKGDRYLRGAPGQAAMSVSRTDTRLGARYRRIARKRGKQKAIVAIARATRDKIREIERLNPGKKVLIADAA
jgi:hypothetical protein